MVDKKLLVKLFYLSHGSPDETPFILILIYYLLLFVAASFEDCH